MKGGKNKMKNLKQKIVAGALAGAALFGWGYYLGKAPQKTYEIRDTIECISDSGEPSPCRSEKRTLKVENEKVFTNDPRVNLIQVNGKLYISDKEDGKTYLTDFETNLGGKRIPKLIKNSDGSYILKSCSPEEEYGGEMHWDKSGKYEYNIVNARCN
jgi:hypothetical protein